MSKLIADAKTYWGYEAETKTPKKRVASKLEFYDIPFKFSVKIKPDRKSWHSGRKDGFRVNRNAVTHIFVEESFSSGRLERSANTMLCTPKNNGCIPREVGEHDKRDTKAITCPACRKIMERWKIKGGN